MDERSLMERRRGRDVVRAVILSLALLLLAAPVAAADDKDDDGPVASFSYLPAQPFSGDSVTFTSTSDGDERQWDTDDDGKYDDGGGRTVSRAFVTPGPHKVRLRVRKDDDEPWSVPAVRTVTVAARPAPNAGPVARFSYTPASPTAGQTVTFTSGSTDSDGRIVKQEWFLDGVGGVDAAGATAARAFPAGTHEVRLVVTDDDGATAEARLTLTVAPAPSPPVITPPTTPTTPPGGTAPPGGSFDLGTPPAPPAVPPLDPVVPVLAPSLQWIEPSPLVRVRGRTTGRGARINLVTVRAPAGARVRVSCRGRSCPSRIAARISRTAGVLRFRQLERFLRAGSVLEFRVTASGRIGRYSRFLVRGLKPPLRTNRCLMPGSLRAVRCPVR